MTEDKIRAFILNACYEDSISYKKQINQTTMKKIEVKNDSLYWSYIVELFIITLKSIMPSAEIVGCKIDYKRFNEELGVWRNYRNGYNKPLLNMFESYYDISYWQEKDDSVYSRMIPIIFTNTNWEIIKEELIKNIFYTTGNISNLIEVVTLSKILYIILNNKYNRNYEDIIGDIKEEIIHLSQKDILNKYGQYYKCDVSTYPGNYTIDFERMRIEILNVLNGIGKSKNYKVLINTLEILEKEEVDFGNIEYNFFVNGLVGLLNGYTEDKEFKGKGFINSLCTYIIKLRKGRISPETLKINKYILPDIFKFNVGEEFFHSLLNKCKVLKKIEDGLYIVSYIKTKSGIYRFFKLKSS
ncbi:hypothetical protein [Caldisalinibacter kiritimatiensis]|uniref:Uncharacterized protein n=1 Tax=Caldisalinibacter kiritimatiensis TaxID=1304284 RepID=R1CF72_9FIRM|nr:hypothetical protein [Caldisalinibacter kiritimatiensis]EOD00940.1 hypothetical protein L21TH_1048 [Caldisalinibacter kiritimatiensis]